MPRGGFSKAARNKRWRQLYGTLVDPDDPSKGRWTYRRLARRYRVDEKTVWYALNPERRPAYVKKPPRQTHPLSTRIGLSRAEHAALKARAREEGSSMMALVRAIVFEGAPPLLLEPEEGSG